MHVTLILDSSIKYHLQERNPWKFDNKERLAHLTLIHSLIPSLLTSKNHRQLAHTLKTNFKLRDDKGFVMLLAEYSVGFLCPRFLYYPILHDEHFILKMLKSLPQNRTKLLRIVPNQLFRRNKFLKECVQLSVYTLSHASIFDLDMEVKEKALQHNPNAMRRIPSIEKTKSLIMKVLTQKNCSMLVYTPEIIYTDREVLLRGVKNPSEHTNSTIPDLMLVICRRFPILILKFYPFIKEKVKLNFLPRGSGIEFEFLSDGTKLVKQYQPFLLHYCSEKELVMKFLQQDGRCLRWVDSAVFKDSFEEMTLVAVMQCPEAILYSHLINKEILLEVIKRKPKLYFKLSSRFFSCGDLLKDRDVLFQLLSSKEKLVGRKIILDGLSFDRELTLMAVKHDGLNLEYSFYKNDKEIVMEALRDSPQALRFASKSLKKDIEVVSVATSINPMCLEFASKHVKRNEEFVLNLIVQCEEVYNIISKQLKRSEEFNRKVHELCHDKKKRKLQ